MSNGRFLTDLILPPRCLVCNERLPVAPGHAAPPLCPDCAFLWEAALRASCPSCYAAYPDCRCATPAMKRAGADVLVKLGPYGEEKAELPVRAVVWRAKRQRRRRLFDFLAGELRPGLLQTLEKESIDPARCVLTWLPRSRRAYCRYGVDQAKELALALSRQTGIPAERLLLRTHDGRQQKELTAGARLENLQKAFEPTGDPDGRTVLLCDDLVTTGAGMAAGTKRLISSGAARVIGVSVAVTPLKKQRASRPKVTVRGD